MVGALHRFERSGLHCGGKLRAAVGDTSDTTFTASKEAVSIAAHDAEPDPRAAQHCLHRFERSGLHCGAQRPRLDRRVEVRLHRFERSGLHCGESRSQRQRAMRWRTSPLRKKRSPLRRRSQQPPMRAVMSSLHRFERSGLHCGTAHARRCRDGQRHLHRFERSGLHCGLHRGHTSAIRTQLHRFERSGLHCGSMMTVASIDRSLRFTASKEAVSIAAVLPQSTPAEQDDFTASKEAVSIAAQCRWRSFGTVRRASPLRKKRSPLRRFGASRGHGHSMSRLHRFERSGLHCGSITSCTAPARSKAFTASKEAVSIAAGAVRLAQSS